VEYRGPTWIESGSEFPLFIREGSVIPTTSEVRVYGKGSIRLRDGRVIEYDGVGLRAPGYSRAILYSGGRCSELAISG